MALPQKLHNPLDQTGGKKKVNQQNLSKKETILRAAGEKKQQWYYGPTKYRKRSWSILMLLHPPRELWKKVRESGLI